MSTMIMSAVTVPSMTVGMAVLLAVPLPGMIVAVIRMGVVVPVILPMVVHRSSPCQNASRPRPRSRARRGVNGKPRTVEWSPSTRSNRWMPSPSSW